MKVFENRLNPRRQLNNFTMAGIFFESREPPLEDFDFDDLTAAFPTGDYSVRGITYEGEGLIGAVSFSHDIPAAPKITYPADDDAVSIDDLVIEWEEVTDTVDGDAANITGYEIIITKEVDDDPNGFSRSTYDVHVPPREQANVELRQGFAQGHKRQVLAMATGGGKTVIASLVGGALPQGRACGAAPPACATVRTGRIRGSCRSSTRPRTGTRRQPSSCSNGYCRLCAHWTNPRPCLYRGT